jgi:hypothetical protein
MYGFSDAVSANCRRKRRRTHLQIARQQANRSPRGNKGACFPSDRDLEKCEGRRSLLICPAHPPPLARVCVALHAGGEERGSFIIQETKHV